VLHSTGHEHSYLAEQYSKHYQAYIHYIQNVKTRREGTTNFRGDFVHPHSFYKRFVVEKDFFSYEAGVQEFIQRRSEHARCTKLL
jgi:hypothetical protein